uniref:Uncharacterized protein n=1 Tax=Timema poppense TaxID=170557 RepID=A0A7R9DI65_TIMPO|nr:unnamed protein product [Timema poppensis]
MASLVLTDSSQLTSDSQHLEKDLGFLRIGSLNMRVKKTTEAFSNFLGVGTPSSDKLHKTWGSADNIQQVEKDLGFLRIGSLNMRVKKTTEAFSNFLGVGTPSSDKLHKTWGSADNIQQVEQVMQPPKFAPVKRRRPRRPQDITVSHSTPSTPPSQLRSSIVGSVADSDSDNACGFDSNWKGTV